MNLWNPTSLAVRKWRHLLALKRAGCAHDILGARGTQPGELAIRCPACPIPGINIPEDWHKLDASTYVIVLL
jgi:hypothetical protein